MTTLGVDQSLKATGLCILRDGEPVEWLTLRSNPRDDLDRRIAGIAKQVGVQIVGCQADVVAIEEPYIATWERGAKGMAQAADAMDLSKLTQAIAIEAARAGAQVVMVAPSDGFRALTGSGKGDKAMHVKWANMRRGRLPKLKDGEDHCADAFGIALHGERAAQLEATG